ncbi:MAG: hypothetical protein HYR91_07220 [Flavobacteriia bacterium]|nr:hypothetical protein [Flavobacteriia bacterium]
MKSFLIILSAFVIIFITGTTLFKVMHWPGGGIMLMLSMLISCCVFFPLFFIHRIIQEKTGLNIIINILGLFIAEILFVGILFKIQHWPGASLLLIVGSVLLIFPTLVLYVIQQIKKRNQINEYWKWLFVGVFLSCFFITLGVGYTRNALISFIKSEKAILASNANIKIQNDNMILRINQNKVDFDANQMHKKLKEVYLKIEGIKVLLLKQHGEFPDAIENHEYIFAKDATDVSTWMLGMSFSEEGKKLHESLIELKFKFTKAFEKIKFNSEIVNQINTDENSYMSEDYFTTWHEAQFNGMPLVAVLNTLSSIQNEILNVENVYLNIKINQLISKN